MITLNNWGGMFLSFFFLSTEIPTHKVEHRQYQPLLSPDVKGKFEASEHISKWGSGEVGKKLERRLRGSF